MPTVLFSMAAQPGTIINGIIVGNFINSHAMAAVSACMPLNQIIYASAVLISMGSSVLIAIAAGKRDNDGANYIFTTVVAVSVFVGMLWAILLIPNSYALSIFLSSAEDLRALIQEYLTVFVWRLPLYLMFFTWQTLIRTDGFAKVVSRGILLGQIINVMLSFVLVANGFGVAGAAVALIFGDVIAMSYIAKKYFASSERSRNFCPLFNDFGKFPGQTATVIKSGIPAASGTALISVKVWAIYQILGSTGGTDAMTLYAICMACLSVVSMCIAGCNGAMMPIIGMLYGEKDFGGVRMLIKYVFKFGLALSGVFVVFAICFPQIILSIYNVPAALFMVAAITNMRNSTAALQASDDLKAAIESTNNKLCANNDGGLFVTAFSGVLDLTTGIFRYVNAGHNPPLIRRNGKNFAELPMELNFVLGGREEWQYVQQEIRLEAGETIFLYTDGVTEAADSAGKMYSLERLKAFLNGSDENLSAKEILTAVSESLQTFSAGAEQADDITMLAVKFERRT